LTPTPTKTPTNTPTKTPTPTPTPAHLPYISSLYFPMNTSVMVNICININNDGGSPITQCGVVYNTTGNPTTADNIIPYNIQIGIQCQNFIRPILNQPYYFSAFATNSVGTFYRIYPNPV
jgi:hypothetical protein